MIDVSKHYGLQLKSEFSALSEIQLGRPWRATQIFRQSDNDADIVFVTEVFYRQDVVTLW